MLLSCPVLPDLYQKSCSLAQDPSDIRDSFQHPSRLIQFLVGLKNKTEPMTIGGLWSPSLDGSDPMNDLSVLINTAIRTTRSLTGIDLSKCTQWYVFTCDHSKYREFFLKRSYLHTTHSQPCMAAHTRMHEHMVYEPGPSGLVAGRSLAALEDPSSIPDAG